MVFIAGGASAAANAQISDILFKRHGRWKSDEAKDGYIKDNIQSLLSVSLSLGISFFFFPFFYVRIWLVLTHPNSGCLLHDKCFIFS